MSKDKQIAFFFGAGAEDIFGMPLGAQYTLDTILSERSQMTEALRRFYKNKINDYSSSYVGRSLFSKNSHTFREIVHRAANILRESNSDVDEDSQKVIELSLFDSDDKYAKEAFFNKVATVFDYVYIDIDKPHALNKRPKHIDIDDAPTKYLSLIRNFSYYGSIEKDFSAIINPKEAGNYRFWRLINYFWSAFFSIILPVLNLSSKYRNNKDYNKNCYEYILQNLCEIVEYIYSDSFGKEIELIYKNSYYYILGQAFNNSRAITTNYTPFLEISEFEKPIYLAGRLSEFEIPEELRIVDIRNNEIPYKKIIFPYMATQAPLKPIIDSVQLREYVEFVKVLDSVDTLVLVGYNLNENDNHINALLRSFLVADPNRRIVFCKYLNKNEFFNEVEIVNNIASKLKLRTAETKTQIMVVPNYGCPNKLLSELKGRLL